MIERKKKQKGMKALLHLLAGLALAVVIGSHMVVAEYALTDAEIQILLDNGFTVTKSETDNTITLEHHGLPDHEFEGGWGNNPNSAEKVNHSFALPLMATVAEEKGCAGTLGAIGIAISGGAFYNPYTGFGYNAVEGECAEDLDACEGHPSPDGTYHYHQLPACLYTGELEDKFLGVALDGYPVYGPKDKTGKDWTSAELDMCHGHYYEGRYMYRATYDFPYIISCFHGNDIKSSIMGGVPGGNGGGDRPPPGGDLPPPDGDRPPPQRRKRHSFQRRQVEQGQCRTVENADWQRNTCYVFCHNANRDYDNCPSPSGVTINSTAATSTVSGAPNRTTPVPSSTGLNGIFPNTSPTSGSMSTLFPSPKNILCFALKIVIIPMMNIMITL